jgi:hypothetical protein
MKPTLSFLSVILASMFLIASFAAIATYSSGNGTDNVEKEEGKGDKWSTGTPSHTLHNGGTDIIVTFSVVRIYGGTIAAAVDDIPINSGDAVEAGKTVVFTATPYAGYRVKEWRIDGTLVLGNRTNTLENIVDGDVTVTVEFELIPSAAKTAPAVQDDDPEGGLPWVLMIGAVIISMAMAVAVYWFVLRK